MYTDSPYKLAFVITKTCSRQEEQQGFFLRNVILLHGTWICFKIIYAAYLQTVPRQRFWLGEGCKTTLGCRSPWLIACQTELIIITSNHHHAMHHHKSSPFFPSLYSLKVCPYLLTSSSSSSTLICLLFVSHVQFVCSVSHTPNMFTQNNNKKWYELVT